MNIYLNDEKIDSSISNENNIGEVFSAISQWIESEGQYIVHFLVDGKEYPTLQDLYKIGIDAVQRLDFYSGSKIELLSQSILELDRYIEVVGNTLFGRDSLTDKESNDLLEGTRWVQEVLDSASTILQLNFSEIRPLKTGDTVSEITESLVKLSESMDTLTSIESYLEKLRTLKIFIIDLQNKISEQSLDPNTIKTLIQTYSSEMETLKNEFIRVNEAYQSGKDLLANELLNKSIGHLHLLVMGLISLKSKNDLKDLGVEESEFSPVIERLNATMNEVVASLENKDIVQAGDLLEYELPEILDSLVPFLKQIVISSE